MSSLNYDAEQRRVSLMREEARQQAKKELAFLAELQSMVQRRLREAKDTWREDKYLTYDLEDRIAQAGALHKELAEMAEGLQGEERYHYA